MLIIIHKTYHRHIAWPQPEDLAHSSPVVEDENATRTSARVGARNQVASKRSNEKKLKQYLKKYPEDL